MRLAILMVAVVLAPASAQQRGMYGGVSTGQMVGSINSTGFASGLGATVSSLPQTGRVIPMGPGVYSNSVRTPGHNWSPRGARTVAVPWGLPITTGYVATVPEYVPVPVPAQVQPSPSVIINQYYSPEQVRPQMKEYDDLPEARLPRTEVQGGDVRVHPPAARQPAAAPKSAEVAEAAAADSSKPTITLLAFKDSSIVAAIAYWEQAGDLHFVTSAFSKRIVPAGALDRILSEQLNKERKVEFKLESMR
ncbi:MAG: hypothetical protein JNK48_31800 [Bryobacterales bacterium]|nr:hypothetical protein [Bryobacterales bacterium]